MWPLKGGLLNFRTLLKKTWDSAPMTSISVRLRQEMQLFHPLVNFRKRPGGLESLQSLKLRRRFWRNKRPIFKQRSTQVLSLRSRKWGSTWVTNSTETTSSPRRYLNLKKRLKALKWPRSQNGTKWGPRFLSSSKGRKDNTSPSATRSSTPPISQANGQLNSTSLSCLDHMTARILKTTPPTRTWGISLPSGPTWEKKTTSKLWQNILTKRPMTQLVSYLNMYSKTLSSQWTWRKQLKLGIWRVVNSSWVETDCTSSLRHLSFWLKTLCFMRTLIGILSRARLSLLRRGWTLSWGKRVSRRLGMVSNSRTIHSRETWASGPIKTWSRLALLKSKWMMNRV